MRIPPRHAHGSWTTSCARGPHPCAVPVTPDRVDEPVRRGRTTGTDPLPAVADAAAPTRYGLSRFPDDGERLPKEVTR
ncbi:hypothetical protein [Streptomyces griseoloalbus]|uniref:Uncharacterized protein n=1 Tax=Streptomyces griseoloalbus TaxID=67303 RepID=A0A7W8F7X8_9ACTN|nr:hypothetical protein [Streptomyces albaduncus]MBB5124535.1 hypothetical protein [Streptomyces albaduncus]GGW74803.1 hypothetical protein GCM10010340_61640 [Streptomyces albaduncus]